MTAPPCLVIGWRENMRTFHLPNLVRQSVIAGSLALAAVQPVAADEPASTVNFVNPDALSSTSTSGWRNPLRSNTTEVESTSGNTLRQTVTQASYEEEMAARGGNLQLRPHTQQSGIFSNFFGSSSKSPSSHQARPTARPTNQTHSSKTTAKFNPPNPATQQLMSVLPQFKSSAARKQSNNGAASARAATHARSVSAPERTSALAAPRPATHAGAQASYSTAASAESYQPAHLTTGGRPMISRGETLGRPSLNASHANPRVAAAPVRSANADQHSPVAILNEAHQLAESARTEADFSKIFAMCQQVPARSATAEETAFGRQLAAWALNRRGQLRARAGGNQAAMADFEQAIHIDGDCWRAVHNRGVLLAQAGQFEQAFDDFQRTIELNPGFAKAYANRGSLYVLAGEIEPGVADYRHAAQLDPELAIAHRGWGRACHMLGRLDEAEQQLTRAIELAPKDAGALASRGDLLTDLGQYEAAANDYERALAINPRYIDACRGSAWLLATCPDGTMRNPGVALGRAQKAMSLGHKPDPTTFDTLAAAQASVGDYRSAAQTIERAIELAPPSERSVYQDRLQMYRHSRPYRIRPLAAVQQAGFER